MTKLFFFFLPCYTINKRFIQNTKYPVKYKILTFCPIPASAGGKEGQTMILVSHGFSVGLKFDSD